MEKTKIYSKWIEIDPSIRIRKMEINDEPFIQIEAHKESVALTKQQFKALSSFFKLAMGAIDDIERRL